VAKILLNGIWYTPVDSASMYESKYESKILHNSEYLFPGYFCFPFKKQVESIYGTGIPDLVLVDRDYREWIIVEVELEHHGLKGDVLDQVVKFASGNYSKSHADYLLDRHEVLDRDKLTALICGTQPRISIFVPVQKPEWWRILLQYNATIAVIEVWEDDTGRNLLRINGDQPTAKSSEFLTNLFRDRNLTKGLKVENPAVLPQTDDIRIAFNGLFSEWVIIKSKSTAWLMPKGKYPLDDVSALSFRLTKSESDGFQLEENREPAT
jgi:hypothetical protein